MKQIKEKLLEMQELIIAEMEQDRDKSASAVTNDIGDSIDHATEERNRELYQLLGERDQHKLDQIQHALEKIDEEQYGICEECGSTIGKKRLLALPFTDLCIDCKSEQERTMGKEDSNESPSQYSDSMDSTDY
ncbi:MAG: TraR/DksA family transcriptional regulator [Proteobacteria bacterium]|nr:TraR/DksA family transcriptional regulator [Pseudomonadota bacterium]